MRVKDLIEKLKKVSPEMEVYCTSSTGIHEYGMVHTAKAKMLTMVDEDGATGEDPKEELLFVIDEK